jgi:hypothetical protein
MHVILEIDQGHLGKMERNSVSNVSAEGAMARSVSVGAMILYED